MLATLIWVKIQFVLTLAPKVSSLWYHLVIFLFVCWGLRPIFKGLSHTEYCNSSWSPSHLKQNEPPYTSMIFIWPNIFCCHTTENNRWLTVCTRSLCLFSPINKAMFITGTMFVYLCIWTTKKMNVPLCWYHKHRFKSVRHTHTHTHSHTCRIKVQSH